MTVTALLTPEELASEQVTVEGELYRHLFRARRLAVGDLVRLVDGRGRARQARVVEVDRRSGRLELGAPLASLEPEARLTLAVAPPRPERASWLVEKATELGVFAVRFVGFSRAARNPGPGTRDRLVRVARAAVEQCGRARLPEISVGHEPEEVAEWIPAADAAWWLDPSGETYLRPIGAGSALLVVGAEGGWDDAERRLLRDLGIPCARLGRTVLRVETAAVVGVGMVLGS